MSVFDRKNSTKKVKLGSRLEISLIKMEVKIIMIFKKNAIIERKSFDFWVIDELKDWSNEKGYSLKITEKEYPVYIAGQHSFYEIQGTRHRTSLHFSR